ncbi:inorganic phosphate transporter, PiT family [Verrucomicrobium sp. GAS474]|uniref:inorganic phosphate transporter n=1 Tax=Verrucomicrobium sp. GAS474 TaxID=1882831 RepID=UPI00087999D0|nr:inorganic phosphate transporter [Verrucomicrobium sp. GAS474]SDT91871.1 inorganic phosphate transporter, PiT family [Verrucomicrobium sp. GAS474]
MHLWGETLTFGSAFFLLLALGLALGFEFINGFHDTANAVATVIYTKSLKPVPAVIWSGVWNLIGVMTSTGAVAFGILALLPVDLVTHVGSWPGFAMVFAILLSAIVWNLGTWWFGLPASSSHTMIGSIIGVGLAYSAFPGMSNGLHFGEGVNWAKAQEVGMVLIISPLFGFCAAGLLLLLSKAIIKIPALYAAPKEGEKPPLGIRALLVLTCTGVSFAHGSNDGQKGMGLLMLILIGLVPGAFALKAGTSPQTVAALAAQAQMNVVALHEKVGDAAATMTDDEAEAELGGLLKGKVKKSDKTYAALSFESATIATALEGKTTFDTFATEERRTLRTRIYLVDEVTGKLDKGKKLDDLSPEAQKALTGFKKQGDAVTKYIPDWVKIAVALALGLGTMIGWKRIVVTVGEKIGKAHLTYGQGAAAELVAWSTIGLASNYGLPVSTTHVLSSGIAGTMAANGSGVQGKTLRNILLAWVLTLPVCIFLGATLFSGVLYVLFHFVGVK